MFKQTVNERGSSIFSDLNVSICLLPGLVVVVVLVVMVVLVVLWWSVITVVGDYICSLFLIVTSCPFFFQQPEN